MDTSVLIKQLHDNKHKVLIIENSFIHNYSISELKKALPEDYIENEFCFFSKWRKESDSYSSESEAILEFFKGNSNKIMVVDSYIEKEMYKFIRACSHKMNMQIFKHNFVKFKAKICRNTSVLQEFSTQKLTKLAKICVFGFNVNTL